MYFNIPGLHNSGEAHWQSQWERQLPEQFIRIQQTNWAAPDCATWTAQVQQTLHAHDPNNAILIGHSMGCATIAHWYGRYQTPIKGALLVAPSDAEQVGFPTYITGFAPLYLKPLPFPSIVVASTDDHVVSLERARFFADCWGSQFHLLQNAGHIEDASGFGAWSEGFALLQQLGSKIS